jgi:hypothetical protein
MIDAVSRHALSLEPASVLMAYGTVQDQVSGQRMRYDPQAITHELQDTVLSYVQDTPRDEEGYAKWLVLLAGRQNGKSLVSTLAFFPKAMYSDGWNHATIADTKERADTLHERIMINYDHWPEEIKVQQLVANEVRSLTFQHRGKMAVHSMGTKAVGIGRGTDSLVWSECAFADDAATQWSLLQPSMINRQNSLAVLECTPALLGEASAGWWRDRCKSAERGYGRDIFAFFPFWDSKLCRRKWREDWKLDPLEEKLLEQYGYQGLDLENLAFRRLMIESDPEISKYPELFGVYYPLDPLSCWITGAKSVIPGHAIARHTAMPIAEKEGFTEFLPPKGGAEYLIGVDPAGFGGRDHASFQIFEMWNGKWKQAASFGAVIDPLEFNKELVKQGLRYNKAMIAVERNGVGVATITHLQNEAYPRIFFDSHFKPGVWNSSHDAMMSILTGCLLDELEIYGGETLDQLKTYQSDKMVEPSQRSGLLSGGKAPARRRERHHWDRVSALMVLCVAAQQMSWRGRPSITLVKPEITFDQMTWNQRQRYIQTMATLNSPDRKRSRYTRGRH